MIIFHSITITKQLDTISKSQRPIGIRKKHNFIVLNNSITLPIYLKVFWFFDKEIVYLNFFHKMVQNSRP